jgi:uncharacterized protein (DUF1800 family)
MRPTALIATAVFCVAGATLGVAQPPAKPSAKQPAAKAVRSAPVAARELTADQQVLQVLNRLGFGARPGDVEQVRAIGVDRWIDRQLQPERIDDAAMDATLARFGTLSRSGADLVQAYPPPAQLLARKALQARARGDTTRMTATADDSAQLRKAAQDSYRIVGELQTAKVARAVASERQLQEVMVDFWENHFNVFAGKDRIRYYLPEYDATIRAHALGNFRELLGAVAKSDAMQQYLDNFQSVADSARPTLAPARRGQALGLAGLLGGRPGAQRRPGQMPNANSVPFDTATLPADTRRRLAELPPRQREAAMDRLSELTPDQRARLIQAGARRPKGLNENYARELMELHTLGVDGGYTQQDVIEVARALTGWSVKAPAQGGGFVFHPESHDAAAKTVLGHTLAAGRGIDDGEDVLDIVAHHPATARYIATKLARRFVSDTPPPALVDRAAATFRRTNGDIRETLRTIVTSPEFFSRAAFRAKVKSPFELVASAARALGAEADTTPRTAQLIARLGQPVFGHQDPNGYPETGDAWMNTGSILNRINFGLAVAANRLPGARLDRWPAATQLANAPREQQVDGVIVALFGGGASPDTRAVLLSGENPLLKSTSARAVADTMTRADDAMSGDMTMLPNAPRAARRAQRRENDPAAVAREAVKPGRAQPPAVGALPQLRGLAQIVGLALGAPEFQRR